MKSTHSKSKTPTQGLVLGDKTFAAITAVEGYTLSPASKGRLAEMAKNNLSPAEQRQQVIKAYSARSHKG